MSIVRFDQRFTECAVRETRTVKVKNHGVLPDGEFAFMDLYCDDPLCDCRRALIMVIRPETGWSNVLATISYGFESLDYYSKFAGHFQGDAREIKGPSLDPFNQQSKYSPTLLSLFETFIESPDYVARLKRHYEMIRGSSRAQTNAANQAINRRKRLRDPRRRGKSPR